MATQNFDINKISSKQKRELDKNGTFTDRNNRQRRADGSVVGGAANTRAVDLSTVKNDVKPYAEQSTDLKDLSIAFSGKANSEQMADIETRNPELARRAAGAVEQSQFVDFTAEDPAAEFTRVSDSLGAEITAIEERMANRETQRTEEYDEAGVFDDLQRLNELKAEKQRVEDRELEIPIEARQKLRGRQATKGEFNQMTRPALENNLLESLAASRNTSRLSDTIQTNIAVIDQRIQAQSDKDEFLYTQKKDRLTKIETIYGNIITEQQKADLEERKFQYDLALEAVKSDNTLRADLIKQIAERGTGGIQLEGLMDASIDELVSFQYEQTDVKNWSDMTFEEAAMVLDKDSFSKFEAYKEWEKTASAEDKAAGEQALAVTQTAQSTITLLEDLLNNETGLRNSVGTFLGNNTFFENFNPAGAGNLFSGGVRGAVVEQDDVNLFRSKAKQLLSQATLDKLLELKAAGGTLGAISEKELEILGNAAIALGSVDKDGKPTGRFNLDEGDFEIALETMRAASMKTFIAANIGKDAYANAGYQFLDGTNAEDFQIIEDRYNDIKENGVGQRTNFADEELINPTNLDTAFNVIRPEEGFRSEAYQDSTGTWTIGYGNTQINGRAVQPGDRVTREQGEQLMQQSVIQNYTNFADTVTAQITPNQFAALTSFEYNLGGGVWQSDTGRRILSLVNEGRMQEAGQLMLQYNKSRDPQSGQLVTNQVLAARRAREADLLLT